jgi:TatD DNase family protein
VHSRDADEDTVRLLQEGAGKGGLRGVIHCFTSTQYLADAALEMGFFISLSGIVTFKNAEDLRKVARPCRSIGCWLKPIPRIWRPCRCAASATSRAS